MTGSAETRERIPAQLEYMFIQKLIQSDTIRPQSQQSDMMTAQLIQSDTVRPQSTYSGMMTAQLELKLMTKLTHSVVTPTSTSDGQHSGHSQAQSHPAEQPSSAEDSQAQPQLGQSETQLNQSLKLNIHRMIQTKRKNEDLEQLSPAKLRRLTSRLTKNSLSN